MLAKLDNFGPFHLFFTLSCGDRRWDENFTTILKEKGWAILWNIRESIQEERIEEEVEVQLENGSVKSLKAFLQEDANDSIHEMIRSNILTATRNFVHRINCFKRDIMMGSNNPMCINKFSWKVEFQGRGAGHIHGTLWCNLTKIKLEDTQTDESGRETEHLEKAFKALRENKELTYEEEKSLTKFVDKFTTCTLNTEKTMEHLDEHENVEEEGKYIIQIVKECQIHHHTKTCRKSGGNCCRFNFPKYPMWETVIAGGPSGETQEERDEKSCLNSKILRLVKEVLNDEEKMKTILEKYDLPEENKSDYEKNRKERIVSVLTEADVTEEDYKIAIKESSNKGTTVVLARDIKETMVNNYNAEWIRAWNANLDIQVCLDFFSVITYITEYFTKVNNLI